ncbi:CLUMA_CG015062, isoform A [Clunio marinus]|uniref:CLUMA_CG015062, isoform A n=1 Tax=Clunio marinus TaxID=568069 RepID=A0A1J1INM4_9DIPT|nr:CLUMA_CG015062, isoform A [Clunio marinus]
MNCYKQLNFGFEYEAPESFVTSEWQNERRPSVKYLIYRWILSFYFNFVLVLSIYTGEECKQLEFYLIYLTNWNVILNAITSLFGAILVTFYYKVKISFENEENRMPKSFKIYWLLTTLSTVVSISLSCIYWPLIYTGRDKGLNDALTHAGNAIVFFIDIFVNAHPPRYGHFVYPLSFGVFYGYFFSLPYTLLGGVDRDYNNYIYSVLDWKNDTQNAIIFALSTVAFLVFMHFVLTFLTGTKKFVHKIIKSRRSETNETMSDSQYDNPSFKV